MGSIFYSVNRTLCQVLIAGQAVKVHGVYANSTIVEVIGLRQIKMSHNALRYH